MHFVLQSKAKTHLNVLISNLSCKMDGFPIWPYGDTVYFLCDKNQSVSVNNLEDLGSPLRNPAVRIQF